MRKLRNLALVCGSLIVIGAIGLAIVLLARTAAAPRTDPDPGAGATSAADARAAAAREAQRTVRATGVIKPMIGAEVRVGSRTSGVVSRLFVRVGDRVRRGQLLAELDGRELDARRGESAAALDLADANLRYAAADLRRKRALAAAQLLPASELELAERAHAVATQQRSQAQATLDYAVTQCSYTRIVAPIAGIVASVSTQQGETVAASFATPTFVTLIDLSRLEVWAYVDETDIGRVRVGQAARFTVDTYAGHEFPGRVTAIYPQAEIRDNVVNYVTVVRFAPARDRVLRPEMTATVRIAVD